MKVKVKKLNNIKVKPIEMPYIPVDKIKGGDIFPILYSNIFICAKKKSGKTSLVFKILKECVNKKTTVVIFCSTVNKDPKYKVIVKWLKEKKIPFLKYTSIFSEDGKNHLSELIEVLKKQEDNESDDEKEETEQKGKGRIVQIDEDPDSDKEPDYKPKKQAPEYLILLDDLSTELGNKNIEHLLKTNANFKCKTIISDQWLHDLKPGSRRQFDYIILFPGISEKMLEKIYKESTLNITYEQFKGLYMLATKEAFNFLYIDIPNAQFRKNLDLELDPNIVENDSNIVK